MKKTLFRQTVFPNGLTLLSERCRAFHSLSIGVWVKAGTRHERPSEGGISHFLEHMLFKGTEDRTALQIASEVDEVGGEFNAFTAREFTCFHLLLLDRDVGLGLDIITDILLNSTFDAEEMERERKVILQEIAMVEESPEELAHDIFHELVYGKHALGRPILGTESSIRRMRREDVLRYFFEHYRPEQLLISVSGNVSHELLRSRLNTLGKKRWSGRSTHPLTKKVEQPPPSFRSGNWWVVRPTEQVHLIWGVQGPRHAAADRFPAFLLNLYLGGGMSSLLFQEIREKKGLAYTVYSHLSQFVDTGLLSIYAATGPSQVPLCVKLIEECVSRLKQELLSEEELKKIKESLKGTILLSADSVEARMSSLAKNHIFLGKYLGADEVCRAIDAVSPADIRRVARKLIQPDRRCLLAIGPKPSSTTRSKLGVTLARKF